MKQCAVCNTFDDLGENLICLDCWQLLTELNREQGIVAFDSIEQDCQ
jgi:hypothetical protein